jgi:hypothetical protein
MAEEKKKKLPTLTTPKGVAKWITLNKPDTKFKKEGQYRVVLLLTPEEAKPLQEKIDAAIEEKKKIAKADPKNKGKKIKDADLPYKQDLNKEGEETGLVSFNFTAKASGVRENGETWTFRPAVLDTKGKPVKSALIYGGSIVRVAFKLSTWATAIGVGASLKMEAVQVIELKTMGERDMSSYGFQEEEGYEDGGDADTEVEAAGNGQVPADTATEEDNQDF